MMTSAADMHPDADDDLAAISPELALVDPDLARRLRERRPPSPLLRLVPPHEAVVEDAEPEPEVATDDPIVPRPAEVESPAEPARANHAVAAFVGTGVTIGVLAAMGESPVSTTDVPGWPIADESTPTETP